MDGYIPDKVTAPVDSDATGDVGGGSSSPAPIDAEQGRAKWWPHKTDSTESKRKPPCKAAKAKTEVHPGLTSDQYRKLVKDVSRYEELRRSKSEPGSGHGQGRITESVTKEEGPLRLRGGGDRDDTMDSSPIGLAPKRLRVGSEEPNSPLEHVKAVNGGLNNIDKQMSDLRSFVTDMIATTKIGRKWQAGIEKYCEEIQLAARRVAMVSATVIGQYSEARTELKEASLDSEPQHENWWIYGRSGEP